MARLSKADRDAIAFLKSLPDTPAPASQPTEKPLAHARKRLGAKTDKRKNKPKRSPEQKRAQTQAARQKAAAIRGVTVTLKTPHWINGISYGPGVVHGVDPDIVKGLLEDERRVEYNNARFDGAQAAFIGPSANGRGGYTARQVPMQLMDSPMLNVLEAFTLQN